MGYPYYLNLMLPTTTRIPRHPLIQAQYDEGLRLEQQVLEYYASLGHTLTPSSNHENKVDDIDAFVDGVGVSVKCNQPRYADAPFCFELEAYSKCFQKWVPSWYFTGKAPLYMVWKRQTPKGLVYIIDKQQLTNYVTEYGWQRVVTLTSKVQAVQELHDRSNARLGLLPISTAVDNGIATVVGVL